ncbi:cell division protein ZapA [Altererythrobacter marinus]|uniref:Cell division protein ZapA n=1 Tax=Pelagerythrobacter marinus TaxID=538382 RepID=A0ABW9UWC3_9SPHN|nr:cell division protein ZapA [Pelagerythrobacter marinus]MXO68100.1 cell division protein ZapA [Pelagerythrobacter marinus]
MSEVTLTIGGRDYAVSCADGEEAHVARLGAAIDRKFQQLGRNVSTKDAQNMLFAALLLADELHEARKEGEALRSQVEEAGAERETLAAQVAEARRAVEAARVEAARVEAAGTQPAAAPPADAAPTLFDDPELGPALERFADLLETCADKLEGKGPST